MQQFWQVAGKLYRNFYKKVCSIFGICKNNFFFFLEQSPQVSSGQLKRSFGNPSETFWRKFKNLQRKVQETMEDGFFSRKSSWQFFRRGSRMQFWPVCWENLVRSLRKSFNFSTCLFVYLQFFLTYDLTDHEVFLSKSYSGLGKCKVHKTAEKKICWKSKNALLKLTKILQKRFDQNIFLL